VALASQQQKMASHLQKAKFVFCYHKSKLLFIPQKWESVNNFLGDHNRKGQSRSGIICLTRLVAIAKRKDPVNKQTRKVRWKPIGFVGSPRKSAIQDVRHLINVRTDSSKKILNFFLNFQIFKFLKFQITIIAKSKTVVRKVKNVLPYKDIYW
jgi:hypothetical protein